TQPAQLSTTPASASVNCTGRHGAIALRYSLRFHYRLPEVTILVSSTTYFTHQNSDWRGSTALMRPHGVITCTHLQHTQTPHLQRLSLMRLLRGVDAFEFIFVATQ